MVAFRTRIRRLALAIVLALIGVFAVLIYLGLSELLSQHIDRELLAMAEQEAARVQLSTGQLTNGEDDDEHELQEAARSAIVRSVNGDVLWKGAAVIATAPLPPNLLADILAGHSAYDTITGPDGTEIRRLSLPLPKQGPPRYILQMERSLRLVQETKRLLVMLLGTLALVLVTVGWFGSRWLAREALVPVQALSAMAERISVPSLSTRMPLDTPYEEFSRLAAAFNAMLERLHRVFDGQRRFIADAAHEIQTPLTVMRGTLEVALQRSRTSEEYRDALATNLEQVERLGTLARSLLTLAQFTGDRPPLTTQSLALDALVKRLAEDFAPLMEDRHIHLTTEIDSVPLVDGDASRLTQLLVNLVDNALAYTPSGGRITIRLTAKDHHVAVQVEDTGPGIAPEHLPKLFDRFYRADPARARQSGGTGLGLAIVKEIAQAHGGDVRVESTRGTGSRFTLTLPLSGSQPVHSPSLAPEHPHG